MRGPSHLFRNPFPVASRLRVRARLGWRAPMPYVFAAIGGSASTYLIHSLKRRYDVGAKPDTTFKDLPAADHARQFERLSGGYRIPSGATLADILPGYLAYLAAGEHRTAVFNTCAELGLFSRLEVSHVVFLVRHPLHAYVSWGKPERHGRALDALGGLRSERAVRRYADRWCATIDEMRRLREMGLLGGLIRFERAAADAAPLGLSWIFDRFDPSRRNAGVLGGPAEDRLRALVGPRFSEVYESWDGDRL
jgi:hypothetical protein